MRETNRAREVPEKSELLKEQMTASEFLEKKNKTQQRHN
jgi:hypothetical protein